MCSVMGCDSFLLSTTQRFRLPEDPEKRLEWVQFLAKTNGQVFKESSWTDIKICSEHFTDDCFENLTLIQMGFGRTLQLKSSAVPSLCPRSPGATVSVSASEEENSDVGCRDEELSVSSESCPEEKVFSSKGVQVSPAPCGISVSCSTDLSYVVTPGGVQTQQEIINAEKKLSKEKAALLQEKGKYLVNESCLLQLFRRNCPSCGSKCQLEKIMHGLLVIVVQQCLKCDYRKQWKSQAQTSLPLAVDQYLSGDKDVTAGTQQALPSGDSHNSSNVPVISETITFSDDSDSSDGGDDSEDGKKNFNSDGEWSPPEDNLTEEVTKESDEEEIPDEESPEENYPAGLKLNQLCPECGKFFNILRPHTCEYKIKPYACNVCGKRCVSEVSLKTHSKIHNEDYEHRCRYCLMSFKTRLDKLAHEQTHRPRSKPYQCPDCSELFANSKLRNRHLLEHRGPKKHICDVCKMEFNYIHQLRRHSVVHTGVKPFVCEVCQRSFNQSGHLKSHMRLHTGERPYKCKHCGTSFNHNVSLKSHVQRYHSQVPGSERKRQMEKTSLNQSESEKDETNEMDCQTGDEQEKEKDFDIVEFEGKEEEKEAEEEQEEEEEDEEEEEEEEQSEEEKKQVVKKKSTQKCKKRPTGRPKGRPKRNAAVKGESLILAVKAEDSNADADTFQAEYLKSATSCGDGSKEEQSDSDPNFDSTEKEKRNKNTGRRRGKPKTSEDSDSDFNPAEKKRKKKSGGQNSNSTSKRGRPKKNTAVRKPLK
ncbi:zinc finger protein 384-like [Myripristis murdjan]|uniref:Zinc finger protein 384-like n=1 Tax=Myripristis murdjan TaxID=586833 RepID=A0A667WRR9_9TELE|nr:zinc finger protein 384-like [Myripristis murdjan]